MFCFHPNFTNDFAFETWELEIPVLKIKFSKRAAVANELHIASSRCGCFPLKIMTWTSPNSRHLPFTVPLEFTFFSNIGAPS